MLGKLVQAEARDPAPAWVKKLDGASTGDIEHAAQKENIIEAPETGTVFGWNKELRLAWRKAGQNPMELSMPIEIDPCMEKSA